MLNYSLLYPRVIRRNFMPLSLKILRKYIQNYEKRYFFADSSKKTDFQMTAFHNSIEINRHFRISNVQDTQPLRNQKCFFIASMCLNNSLPPFATQQNLPLPHLKTFSNNKVLFRAVEEESEKCEQYEFGILTQPCSPI